MALRARAAAAAAASALAGHNIRAALRAGAWQITLVGATLGVGQTLCFWESLHTLDTSVAILLFYTYPALTLAVERVVFKQPILRRAAVCVAVILLGAAIITVPGMSGGLDSRGLAWVLPSPLIYALYLAANSLLMRRYPPLVGAICLYLGLAASFTIATSYLGLDVPATAGTWFVLLVIAFGPGAPTVVLFSYSVPRLGPGSYAIIANCELVTVVALGEELTASRVLGGALIASAILVHGFFG
jgi:drug/metabolite transporter (DMT)-like permease